MSETLHYSSIEQPELQDVFENSEVLIDQSNESLKIEQTLENNPEIDKEFLSDEEWAEELRLVGKYVDFEAEYHVGRKFMIGAETYEVWFTKPDGWNGDYTTLFIDIKNLNTGEMIYAIEPAAVDAMIQSAENPEKSDALTTANNVNSQRNNSSEIIENGDEQQERRKAIQAFDELVHRQPEFESQRAEFMQDLENYIVELKRAQTSDYDLVT